MAVYKFWAVGKSGGEPYRIEFEFEDDTLTRCLDNGRSISVETATRLFRLDEVHGPGYVLRGKPNSRLNALNFLIWNAFDREPEIGGDPGNFDADDIVYPEGAVF